MEPWPNGKGSSWTQVALNDVDGGTASPIAGLQGRCQVASTGGRTRSKLAVETVTCGKGV